VERDLHRLRRLTNVAPDQRRLTIAEHDPHSARLTSVRDQR
jgi:hypothetical protein